MASIGIDLGTTNSVGAFFDGRNTRILSSSRADGLVPSVVTYRSPRPPEENEGTILVGQAALNYAHKDPPNAIFSVKRLMGRHYDDPKVAEVADRLNYSVTHSADSNSAGVRVLLGGKEFTPVEISALILKAIKESAERTLGEEVTHAVITVPAYFGEPQRAATRAAGEQAGLIVKKIIDEPTAAAISYGVTVAQGQRTRLLVYDLGGGTFDASVILTTMDAKGKIHFEVLDYRGDNWLGGDDFDREIVGEMVAWTKKTYDFDPSGDKIFQLLAKQASELAKIALSDSDKTDITLPGAYKTPEGRILDVDMTITRQRFESLIQPYVDTTLMHVKKALTSQGLQPEDITSVLMVGGSTLVPLVYQSVAALFGKEKVQQMMNPYHAVALGAGILAGTLKGIECPNKKCKNINSESAKNCTECGEPLAAGVPVGETVSITERTPESVGIRAIRGAQPDVFEVIVPKGEIYPFLRPKTKIFYTSANNFIRVPILRGDDPVASKNHFEGLIELTEEDFKRNGVDVPINSPVEVAVNYDRNRIFDLRVRIPGTVIERELTFKSDVAARAPVEQKAEENWKANLEKLLNIAEYVLGRYAPYMEEREQKRLCDDIEKARDALASENPKTCQDVYYRLVVAIDSCGVASLLFQAEQLQGRASTDRRKKIDQVIGEIKENWHEGNRQVVEQLRSLLANAIAMENRMWRERKPIPNQKEFQGYLRVADT
jgi:molecular chaperone DnaK